MSTTDELLANNQDYAASFDKADLPVPPARKVAVVACMDARLNVYRVLGLQEGDAHVIRNAGGVVTDDAIRSLAISQRLLGTEEIVLIHHTDCGMLTFTSDALRRIVKDAAPGDAAVAARVDEIDFLEFQDLHASVKEDVAWVKGEALLLPDTTVTGWVYDVKSGRVVQVT